MHPQIARWTTEDRCVWYYPPVPLVAIVVVVAVIALSVQIGSAEVAFERVELTVNGAVDAWLHGDVDRDGDSDLLLLRTEETHGAPAHMATFILQNPPGHYDYPARQSFPLHDSSGVYELADVAGGKSLELVQMSGNEVRYFPVNGNQFDPTPVPLFRPQRRPHLPSRSAPAVWDFGWPILSGQKECLVVPFVDELVIYRSDANNHYTAARTIPCASLYSTDHGAEFAIELPKIIGDVSSTSLDIFLHAGQSWHGLRRPNTQSVEFEHRLVLNDRRTSVTPLLSLGPGFVGETRMRDLNGDRSPEVFRWNNSGGVNQSMCRISFFFGPIGQGLPPNPHAEVSVEGVVGYPEFGDMDGDGREDMLVCAVETGALALGKIFVMKKLTLYLLAYHQRPDNTFSVVPDKRVKIDYRLDLNRAQPIDGPLVRFVGDLNGNGTDDLVVQTGSGHLAVYLTSANGMINNDPQRLDCANATSIQVLDLDGDSRQDIFLAHRPTQGKRTFTAFLVR